MTVSDSLKILVPLAVPAIKSTVETWLIPWATKLIKNKSVTSQAELETIRTAFEEYLLRTYARLTFVSTVVFGNQQKRIQELYIPLTVSTSRRSEGKSFKIDKWINSFVPAFKRVVITDTAGMGKSTILKWLFLSSIGANNGIPIFIELRSLSAEKRLIDRILEELCPINKDFDRDLLIHLIDSGKFIFFLDGFDEVSFEDRRKVTEDLQDFVRKGISNLFVLASRHESALASFGDFQEFTINPLTKSEAYELLKKYDDTLEHSEALTAELEGGKYEQLKDLLINPMLVSLLYKAYSYKPKVPFKKPIFYRQVFDALFDMHDSTKGGAFVREKHSKLDIDEFHTITRELGFVTAKIGKIEYGIDELTNLIKKVRTRNQSILFPPTALLKDLISTVPLFNKEGDHYKWAHKSVQDYFASQFIAVDAKGKETAILDRIYDGGHCSRFENMLDMLHDSDNLSFRRVLLAKFLKDFVHHYDNSYQHTYEGVSEEALDLRRQFSFGRKIALSFLKNMKDSFLERSYQHFSPLFSSKLHPIESISGQSIGAEIICMQAVHHMPPFGLLPLLLSRKYSYVSKAKRVTITKQLSALPFAVPLLVTDDINSPLNQSDVFELVNRELSKDAFCISIQGARRTLESIEQECNNEGELEQLLQDL